MYRFIKIVGKSNFSEQFRKLINRYKRIGYSLDILRRTACLVVGPVIVDGCASLFYCTAAVRASDWMTASSWDFNQWVGAWWYVFGLARRGSTVGFHLLRHTVELAVSTRLCLLWWLIWFLCFRFGALAGLGAFMRAGFLCVSVLRVASGPPVGLAGCKSALTPPHAPPPSTVVAQPTVLRRWSRWWSCTLLLCGLFYEAICCVSFRVSFCSCVFRSFWCFDYLAWGRGGGWGGRMVLVLFVRLFGLCLFGFVGFLFLLGSGKGCGLWLWHSLDFSLTFLRGFD